jgi:hypothetical protein
VPFLPGKIRFCVSESAPNFAPDLPETPLARFHDPEAEKKVGDGVGQDARCQAFRPIRDAIEESPRKEGDNPVRSRMGKPEPDGRRSERKPGKRSKRDRMEFFVHEITEKESAPKNLLDQWNDNNQPQKTKGDRGPVHRGMAGKGLGIEASKTRRETEKFLGCNPERKNQECHRGGKDNSPRRTKLILAPEPEEERAAEYRLGRVDPVMGRVEPEVSANFSESAAQDEQRKKRGHRKSESHQFACDEFVIRRIHLVFWLDG